MPADKLEQLAVFGQSIWLDYINRQLIESGALNEWIAQGLKGMTSNPAIFNQVISRGTDYDDVITRMHQEGCSVPDIYDALTIRDIQDAADCFNPVYEQSNALDGYVSLEINPLMADDTEASIKEGLRLFDAVHRPNVMIKVPATEAGFPVVTALLAQGVNVNVTLIFSIEQYCQTAAAYLDGLQQANARQKDLRRIHSVASVFVSRVDTKVDQVLKEKLLAAQTDHERAIFSSLQGRVAVANARLIYEKYRQLFSSGQALQLKKKGACPQRVLWASTSTKNPAYSDIKYVEELIAKDTVNTVPEKTLFAYLDHGQLKHDLALDEQEARTVFKVLPQTGIQIDDICRSLLADGVDAFKKSFADLFHAIEKKKEGPVPV